MPTVTLIWSRVAPLRVGRPIMHDHANGRGDIGHSSFVMTGETPVALNAPVSFRLPVTREIIERLRDEILLTKTERAALRLL
jgi:hypothetical protein